MNNTEKIVYYDGLCGLCDGSISLILKFDKNNILKYSSLQGKSGQVLLRKLNKDLKEFDTFLFKVNDQVYTKSTAVFKIIETIGGLVKVLLIFNLFPTKIEAC